MSLLAALDAMADAAVGRERAFIAHFFPERPGSHLLNIYFGGRLSLAVLKDNAGIGCTKALATDSVLTWIANHGAVEHVTDEHYQSGIAREVSSALEAHDKWAT